MSIKSTVQGNLVTLAQAGKYRAIVQGCNCFCVMGSGLAPQIAKAWPEAEFADSVSISGDPGKLGNYTYHHDTTVDLLVFNLYTQFGFGEHPYSVNYEAIRDGFTQLNRLISGLDPNKRFKDTRPVGIPMIGAGLAGGHWEAIKIIIDMVTPDIEIELVEYKP